MGAPGGGEIGADYQFPASWLVVGLEADADASRIGKTATWRPGPAGTVASSADLRSLFTVRGGIGAAFGRVLVYATSGWACGRVRNDITFSNGIIYNIERPSGGYTAGGGVEWAFLGNWSAKAEYQYIRLGQNCPIEVVTGVPFCTFAGTTTNRDTYNTIRLGLNYRFGGGR